MISIDEEAKRQLIPALRGFLPKPFSQEKMRCYIEDFAFASQKNH